MTMHRIQYFRGVRASLTLLCMLLTIATAAAQNSDSASSTESGTLLERIHVDATSALFITSIAIAADISYFRNPEYSLGMQAGLDFLATPALMDKSEGTPFIDVDLLGRFVFEPKGSFSFEIVAGYSYRISLPDDVEYYPTHQLKFGAGVQWNLSRLVKLHGRLRGVQNASDFRLSQCGLGLSIGWQRD